MNNIKKSEEKGRGMKERKEGMGDGLGTGARVSRDVRDGNTRNK